MTSTAADPRRAAAKLLWTDASISVAKIAIRIGASSSTVSRWAKDDAWPSRRKLKHAASKPAGDIPPAESTTPGNHPPTPTSTATADQPASDSTTLIERLFRIINYNVQVMENRMSDDSASGRDPERDMRAIGSVVRSVETLKELESEQSKRDNASERAVITPDEEDRIRRKVVEHILKLRERKRREGSDR